MGKIKPIKGGMLILPLATLYFETTLSEAQINNETPIDEDELIEEETINILKSYAGKKLKPTFISYEESTATEITPANVKVEDTEDGINIIINYSASLNPVGDNGTTMYCIHIIINTDGTIEQYVSYYGIILL